MQKTTDIALGYESPLPPPPAVAPSPTPPAPPLGAGVMALDGGKGAFNDICITDPATWRAGHFNRICNRICNHICNRICNHICNHICITDPVT